jgi:hypothetical protein
VTNATSISVEKLLTHQRRKWQSPVEPGTPGVVERFRNSVQNTFKDYKTMYAP